MFNALTVSALQANPHHPRATTAQFTPLTNSRQPNRKDILQLLRSALSYAKDLGTDGTPHGYMGLVVDGNDYARVTNNAPPYQIPVHPGPVVPQGANQLAAYQNEENHKRQLKTYEDHQHAHSAVKAALLQCIPEEFVAPLMDPEVHFSNVTVLQIFHHLMTTYGTVTREDLDHNEEELKAPWSPTTPIESLWLQATRAQRFPPATDALSNSYVLRALINNVRNTNTFESTLKRFDELPAANQTLVRFKEEMNRSYKLWVQTNNRSTASAAGYSSANIAQTPPPSGNTGLSKYAFCVGTKVFAYCWTHGLSPVRDNRPEHNSHTCTNRRDGHQEDATFDNLMRGLNPCSLRPRCDNNNNNGE